MDEQRTEENDRRQEILEAALRVFAEHGFGGATVKEIAREAGIRSPALIYWYFRDKQDLFKEVLGAKVPVVRAVSDLAKVMDLPPEEALTKLGQAYFAFARMDPRVLRLMVGEAIRRPEVAEAFVRGGPGRVLEFLKRYLERQIELGCLLPHDVRSGARMFVGMLIPHSRGSFSFRRWWRTASLTRST